MANRGSLNKVQLIGNIVRDPELKETKPGVQRALISLATNRGWTTESGEKKEQTEFHKIVAWQKLAEICGKLLTKGRKVYIEGRLSTREWVGDDDVKRKETEIIMEDMILLDPRKVQAEEEKSGDEMPF